MSTVQFNLQGRSFIITGAARGIGAACAERLCRDGAAVGLWDVDVSAGEALAASLQASGHSAHFIACDVAVRSEVDRAVSESLSALGGRIQGLVNSRPCKIQPNTPTPECQSPECCAQLGLHRVE